MQPLPADIDADADDDDTGEIRRTLREGTKTGPAARDVAHAKRCDYADRHHGNGKANTETQHERYAERELFKLQAKQQNGDGGRARNEAACEAEHHNLTCCHTLCGEAAAEIARMRRLVRILRSRCRDIEAVLFLMCMRMHAGMIVLGNGQLVAMGVVSVRKLNPRAKFMRLRN